MHEELLVISEFCQSMANHLKDNYPDEFEAWDYGAALERNKKMTDIVRVILWDNLPGEKNNGREL